MQGDRSVAQDKELVVLDQMMAVLLKLLYVQNGDIANVRPINLGDLSVALDLMTLKQTVRMLSVEKEKVLAALDQMMVVLQRLLSVLNGDIANVLLINLGILNVDLDLMLFPLVNLKTNILRTRVKFVVKDKVLAV